MNVNKYRKPAVLLALIGIAFCYGFVLGSPRGIEGYKLTIYKEEFMIWEQMPVMAYYEIQGTTEHPGIFRVALTTIEGIYFAFDLYNGAGNIIYSTFDVNVINYESEAESHQEFGMWWSVYANGTCGFSCPVKSYVEVWEWQHLENNISEWVMNDTSGS